MKIFLDDILRSVGEPDAEFPLFMKLEPIVPMADDPDFSEKNVLAAAKLTDSDDEGTDRLCKAAAFLRENEPFRLAATQMYRAIFLHRKDAYVRFSAVDELLGESIRMLIRSMSAFSVKKLHEERQIPDGISRDTLRYLRAVKGNFIGCFPNAKAYSWFRQLMYPDLWYLHIVRLGFAVAPRSWDTITMRHENGSYLTFAKPGLYVNSAGMTLMKEEYDRDGGSKTDFRVENGFFVGNVVAENGRIDPNTEKVPVDGCRPYLTDDMTVINMHIPGGGGLTMDLLRRSWHEAKNFYTARLGSACPKVIACGSWTCSPEMEEVLPPDAHLVQFVHCFRRLPHAGCIPTLKCFIHSGTSLSRALDNYIDGGGIFREGSMFLPLDEIE